MHQVRCPECGHEWLISERRDPDDVIACPVCESDWSIVALNTEFVARHPEES